MALWSILILKKRKSPDSVTCYPPRKAQADNSAGHLECTRKVAKQLFPQGAAQMRQTSFASAVKLRKERFKRESVLNQEQLFFEICMQKTTGKQLDAGGFFLLIFLAFLDQLNHLLAKLRQFRL